MNKSIYFPQFSTLSHLAWGESRSTAAKIPKPKVDIHILVRLQTHGVIYGGLVRVLGKWIIVHASTIVVLYSTSSTYYYYYTTITLFSILKLMGFHSQAVHNNLPVKKSHSGNYPKMIIHQIDQTLKVHIKVNIYSPLGFWSKWTY